MFGSLFWCCFWALFKNLPSVFSLGKFAFIVQIYFSHLIQTRTENRYWLLWVNLLQGPLCRVHSAYSEAVDAKTNFCWIWISRLIDDVEDVMVKHFFEFWFHFGNWDSWGILCLVYQPTKKEFASERFLSFYYICLKIGILLLCSSQSLETTIIFIRNLYAEDPHVLISISAS